MKYIVKWVVSGKTIQTDHRIDRPTDAMDFACAIFEQNPEDIWVETEDGLKIADRGKLETHCQKRGLKL